LGKPGASNQSAARKIPIREVLLTQLGEFRAEARIDDENRHLYDIGERTAALLQERLDIGKGLPRLRFEISVQRRSIGHLRRSIPGQPDNLLIVTAGDDGRRERPVLLPGTVDKFAFHVFNLRVIAIQQSTTLCRARALSDYARSSPAHFSSPAWAAPTRVGTSTTYSRYPDASSIRWAAFRRMTPTSAYRQRISAVASVEHPLIGINCRLCEHSDYSERAFPP
tara:strand:- start:4866 stop:5537 length:672 start_codon:yes stop_codon:yes gene_type:complete